MGRPYGCLRHGDKRAILHECRWNVQDVHALFEALFFFLYSATFVFRNPFYDPLSLCLFPVHIPNIPPSGSIEGSIPKLGQASSCYKSILGYNPSHVYYIFLFLVQLPAIQLK